MLLYSSRAVKKCLNRMDKFHLACSSLFILVTMKKKRVSQSTISFWIRTVIAQGHGSFSDDGSRTVKVRVHSL